MKQFLYEVYLEKYQIILGKSVEKSNKEENGEI